MFFYSKKKKHKQKGVSENLRGISCKISTGPKNRGGKSEMNKQIKTLLIASMLFMLLKKKTKLLFKLMLIVSFSSFISEFFLLVV